MIRFIQDNPDRSSGGAVPGDDPGLSSVSTRCAICDTDTGEPVGVGEDFEYRTCPDTFVAVRCPTCGLVYLNPRPAESELGNIYPTHYHAFEFTSEEFGWVFAIRRRLEAHRLGIWCRGLPADAKIIDIGCGDGFHLKLLKDYGEPGWSLEGIDLDERAVVAAKRNNLVVHQGAVQSAGLPLGYYDMVLLIMTIEHVASPGELLAQIHDLLKPGGRLVIVTDNIGSLSFRVFRGRHWGGYHFPRHWNLFDKSSLVALCQKVGLQAVKADTATNPVNWVYSIRNLLDDWGAPRWLVKRFSLHSPMSLGLFTLFDMGLNVFGGGSALEVILRKPEARA